jgi:DNA end-binding protein Ku
MSARAIASVTISFGLVSIPTKVYSSGESSTGIRFNMLHEKCGTRLKQKYYCPKDNEEVERKDMIKGYEFSKGQFVLFTDEEMKTLQEKATQSIDITEFIPTETVDPIYFEKAYYLGPDKGGDRAFKLLSRALTKSGRSALAKYAARGKMYLVLLRPFQDGLIMQQLRYADEIRSIDEVPLGDATVKPAELDLALQIVEQGISDDFKPEGYGDEVRERTLKLIEQKIQGKEITEAPAEEPKAQVIDLMQALKASLEKKSESGRKPAKRAPRAAAKKRSRSKG